MIGRFLYDLANNICRPSRLRRILHRADRARDVGNFVEAADSYSRALALVPGRIDIKIQLANMLKDSRRLAEAEVTYTAALESDPLNADTHLQFGHLLKLTGRRGLALRHYARALELNPLLSGARRELAAAGEGAAQLAAFELQMRQGGTEALLTIRTQLDEISAQIDHLRTQLPDASASAAYPLDAYKSMRRLFDVVAPTKDLPNISVTIILLADFEPLSRFHAQLNSIQDQSFEKWDLIVLGGNVEHRQIVHRMGVVNRRIRWIEVDVAAPLASQELQTARAGTNDWIVFLGKGALLHRQALRWIATVAEQTGCDAIVTDEEVGDIDSFRGDLGILTRQTVDIDSMLEANIYGETVAVARKALEAIDLSALPNSISASRSYLLLSLIADRRVAHVPLPLVNTIPQTNLVNADSQVQHTSAVRAYLSRCPGTSIEPSPWSADTLRVFHRPEREHEVIAIIIPTKDNSYDVGCLTSSLLQKAKFPERLEIIIINNGQPFEGDELMAKLAENPLINIINFSEPFNWSRFNNFAINKTSAPYLVFANDDMLMLTHHWDQVVRTFLERTDVGAVGARLLYPDDTLQHGGILFNWKGSVIHDGLYQSKTTAGPAKRWHLTRSVSAVTGAFIATRRSDFSAVGGFDEAELAISYSDVDYALKLRSNGYRILWTPMLTLYHYESKTRGLDQLDSAKAARDAEERRVVRARWGKVLDREPSLNPIWMQATLPHRLFSFPSEQKLWEYIEMSASAAPWLVGQEQI